MTSAPPEPAGPRKNRPENNRAALIEATLDVIAETGVAGTTVSRIIDRAGLSRGMIHLHFGGKTQLLTAAAKAFNEQYYEVVDRHVAQAEQTPEGIIKGMISADLSEELLNERSTRIWNALRGAAFTNAEIAEYSNSQDSRSRDLIGAAFEQIAGEYDTKDAAVLASDATFGLLVLLEGMSVDFHTNADNFSREVAQSLIYRFLSGLFPDHFRQDDA